MFEPANSNDSNLRPAVNPPASGTPMGFLADSPAAAGSIIISRMLRKMGFSKLDENLLQSSILREDDFTFKVFMLLLAASKQDNIARVSPVFVASITGRDIEDVRKAFEKLQGPDPDSRSINDNGARIRRVDGGWLIINRQKYRDGFDYSDNPESIRKREYRKRKNNDLDKNGGTNTGHEKDISVSVSVSDSVSGIKEGDIKGENSEAEIPDYQKVIDFWQSCKNTITHKTITEKMVKVIKDRLKEYPFQELGNAVYLYDKMMGSEMDFYGKYPHGLDDFFRDGIKKKAPFTKFLPEANPLKTLWKRSDDFE